MKRNETKQINDENLSPEKVSFKIAEYRLRVKANTFAILYIKPEP